MEKIEEQGAVIKTYVYEAIEIEKAGIKVDFKAKNELVYPEEFQKNTRCKQGIRNGL